YQGLEEAMIPIDAMPQFNPWDELTKDWLSPEVEHFQYRATLSQNSSGTADMDMAYVLPTRTPTLPPLELYWNERATFKIDFGSAMPVQKTDTNSTEVELVQVMRN